ncbi:hypothetical protein LCGC14_0431640 [marine sediment metagenome]|uniref:Metalloenzyme domain-containing protein n=1 Tax=marine sediment metagenome TaxID=412755 RepID=A0A0F9SU56_9ZZZZ|nr:hypothetical protein [Phycisphaerae bacterium]HDZ42993.1 hypothetical protein [Phycisphaerae bacterium]
MKYVIVIPEGAADQPIAELAHTTPLAAADTPNMDWLAVQGRCGTVRFTDRRHPHVPQDALMALLGYDPGSFALGGGALEALGLGLDLPTGEQVFRCNLVTVAGKSLTDATAGTVSPQEAVAVIGLLNEQLAPGQLTFHVGSGHRHLMTSAQSLDVQTTCPYEVVGKAIRRGAPKGPDASRLQEIMALAAEALKGHEINAIRRELGESPITGIWLWGEGVLQPVEPFAERFGCRGAILATDPLVRGLGRLVGWDVIDIPTGEGYTDTHLSALAEAAVEAIDTCDIVCVHVSWPDDAALAGDVTGKIAAIEAIDRDVVGGAIRRLRGEQGHWRMLVAPSRSTVCKSRQRTNAAVPFVVAGERVKSVLHLPFSEAAAAKADIHIKAGCELMEYFLTVR